MDELVRPIVRGMQSQPAGPPRLSAGRKITLAVAACLVVLVGIGAYVFLAALGDANGVQRRSNESCLRGIGAQAPAGAYWLGPNFRDARLSSSCGWSQDEHYSVVDYQAASGGVTWDLYLHVYTVARGAENPYGHQSVEVRKAMPGGEDVILEFIEPVHPTAALTQQARAAIQLIPKNVTYSD